VTHDDSDFAEGEIDGADDKLAPSLAPEPGEFPERPGPQGLVPERGALPGQPTGSLAPEPGELPDQPGPQGLVPERGALPEQP
jgi:hypothetical protein